MRISTAVFALISFAALTEAKKGDGDGKTKDKYTGDCTEGADALNFRGGYKTCCRLPAEANETVPSWCTYADCTQEPSDPKDKVAYGTCCRDADPAASWCENISTPKKGKGKKGRKLLADLISEHFDQN